MEDYSFINKLGDRDFYGVARIRGNGWYLCPGWSRGTKRIKHSKELSTYNDIYHGACVQLAEAWKPCMNNLDTMFTDATCYESEVRYPTDQKLLWECVEKGVTSNFESTFFGKVKSTP